MKFLFSFFKKRRARGLDPRTLGLWAGLLIALIISIFFLVGLFESAEVRSLDWMMRLRGPLAVAPQIKIIGIDDLSLNTFGRWPWARSYHAALLEILSQFGPKVVLYDVIFAEPTEANPTEDQAFAEMIAKSGRVVLGSFFNPAKGREKISVIRDDLKTALAKDALLEGGVARARWFHGTDPTLPIPIFQEAALGSGFVNTTADEGGEIRRVPPVISFNKTLYPSLVLKGLMAYWGISKDGLDFSPGHWIEARAAGVPAIKIPVNRHGEVQINYPGSLQVFSTYSYAQLMAAYYNQQDPRAKEIFNQFKDSIVLIGITATATTDLITTPFAPLEPGIVMHAGLLNTILTQRFIHELPLALSIALFIVVGLALGWLIPRADPSLAFASALGLFIFYPVLSFVLFIWSGLWLPVVSVLSIVVAGYLLVLFVQFIGERFEKSVLEQELSIAEKIQRSFLPRSLPKSSRAAFAADTAMAKTVGGDLYDFISFDDGLIGVAIGDVSGKGVPASLYMAKTISDFRTHARSLKEPAPVVTELNRTLVQEGAAGMFVTFFYILLDLRNGKCVFSNAGHHPLLKWDALRKEIVELNTKKGRPLGILPFKDLDQGETALASGDILLLYTDGIDEAMNTARKTFGKDRIHAVLRQNAVKSPEELIRIFQEEVRKFCGKAPQHDDMTLVAIKIS